MCESIEHKDRYRIDDLLQIMELLRSPEGCPWDREQTHHSIRKNFIEEVYEAAEAIDNGDTGLLREELGDVLLQVVFHAQIEREAKRFDFDDVCDDICKKLIRRHPHVFADAAADTAGQGLQNWEDIKKSEKDQETVTQTLHSVPKTLPALMRAEKVQKRAAKSGFDYPDINWAIGDLRSEIEELAEAVETKNKQAITDELGDLLFAAVNVARFVRADPEESLTKSTGKFISRFSDVEQLAKQRGIDFKEADIDLLDSLWQEVKNNRK